VVGQAPFNRLAATKALGVNAFDGKTNMHLYLQINKTTITAFDGYCWMKVRAFYPEDSRPQPVFGYGVGSP
jgi:hypothetical protein